ncbi:proline dehydrogenase family protein [Nitrosopumilus sp. K4]|uniref:proline dehydrogenase family protein n=1 Tax=Nitrosopumilus sp. K4 TaxID=2795383 RepID=UPI001BA7A270|nr:proline dehydrogenase family protein [Nitrosopumilus sp. K4]QUC64143.1 proline dehydrogenase family protein [Nitrosopumilus sp. K4]
MVDATKMMEKFLFKFAKQWIAGDTIDDALKSAKEAYENGRHAIVNKLGEYHKTREPIEKTITEYEKIISSFRKWKVRGAISVKPTQVGMSINGKTCLESFERLIDSASKSHVFVWIDMESSDHTDDTIQLYYDLFSRYERLGVAIQANLKRSVDDVKDLIRHGAKIRIVKGAYRENGKIAYKTRDEVDQNFLKIMRLLFKDANEFGVATHDSKLIDEAISLSKKYQKKFEFQLLKGVRDELKPELVNQGFIVSDYIPYGTNWLPYSIRRLQERKRNILLLGSSFIQSHKV